MWGGGGGGCGGGGGGGGGVNRVNYGQLENRECKRRIISGCPRLSIHLGDFLSRFLSMDLIFSNIWRDKRGNGLL